MTLCSRLQSTTQKRTEQPKTFPTPSPLAPLNLLLADIAVKSTIWVMEEDEARVYRLDCIETGGMKVKTGETGE